MMEEPSEEQARLLGERAWKIRLMGSLPEARVLYHRALEQWKALGNQTAMAETLAKLGDIAMDLQEREEAEACLQQSAALWQKLGDWAGYSDSLRKLNRMARSQGRYGNSEEWRQHRWRLHELGFREWDEALRRQEDRG
ncbi:MAG: tetratricopeptide repeat protein [Chloroflexi bacterium]|nr:tetratricopeptide repeat protein [Chloroflexota bacterium]